MRCSRSPLFGTVDDVELVKDFWRCALVSAPAAEIVARGSLEGLPLTWLPGTAGLQYRADPFGLWRDDRLYVFAEQFDYREGIGRIDVIVLDSSFTVIEERPVLRERWHLSYPFVFAADGETWLLPEAYEAGALHLYRARAFPFDWTRAATIALPDNPLDATPCFHEGRWWLFYAPSEPATARLTTLCAAYADNLAGPWTPFVGNPILTDPRGARPGGTPLMIAGVPYLPLQRCVGSYGTGVRMLRLDTLLPEKIVATIVGEIEPPTAAAPFFDGLHTLSAAGDITLIDVKRRRFSSGALAAWPRRALRRATQLA